jgi:glycosyltransferase involved in cell wall biosynthesis
MFVQPELPHLASAFANEGITIVPLHDEGNKLPLPDGVQLDRSLALHWKQKKISSYLLAPTWPGFLKEFRRGWRYGKWIGAARVWRWAAVAHATWQWLQAFGPSKQAPLLIYTYWRGGQTMAAARYTRQHPNSLTVSRVHRYELYEEAFTPPFQPWTSIYREIKKTIPIAQHGDDYLLNHGVPKDSLMLSRLGVPEQPMRMAASADGVIRLVSCSSITPVKRLPLIAQAIIAFAHACNGISVCWTHFGDGPQRQKLQAELINPPANLQINLRGQTEHPDVIRHYLSESVDLFISLSSSEGIPVSIQEALSVGIPVLATDVGGVSEAVNRSGDNGTLLDPDTSIDTIVQHLKQLLIEESPEQRASRRVAAWHHWARNFDAEKNHRTLACTLRNELQSLNSCHPMPFAGGTPSYG